MSPPVGQSASYTTSTRGSMRSPDDQCLLGLGPGYCEGYLWHQALRSVFGGGSWCPIKPVPLVRVEVLQASHHRCTVYPWLWRGTLQECCVILFIELDLDRGKGAMAVFA